MNADEKNLQLNVISSFYRTAFDLLKKDNRKDAEKVLYEAMPKNLYDISLDILDNRNDKMSNEKLRKLISSVDKILNPTLIADEEV